MRHHAIILNPAAAHGNAGERANEIAGLLNDAGIRHEMLVTERPGHAVELTRAVATDRTADVVVAAGGDGTANEVINGLMAARDAGAPDLPSLGVLPVGRGNDFAYGVGVPTDAEAGASILADRYEEPLDIGYLEGGDFPDGRYFGNGIGVGFDTIVGLEAAKLKRLTGFPAYAVAAFKTLLFYYVTPQLELVIDSQTVTQECIQVSLMNGQRLGGGFFMAPDAHTGDGSFNWCIAAKPRRGQMLGLLLKYMKGTQSQSKHITTGLAKRVKIRALEGTMAIHADGETICTEGTEILFECVPSPLRVVTAQPAEP